MHNARRRGKGQSRILYWFRTPPGVRVGRSAIDEDAIRLLEEHNPDVQFDWTHILKATPAPAAPPPDQGREASAGRGAKRKDRRALGEERRAMPRGDERRLPRVEARPPRDERGAIEDEAIIEDAAIDEPSSDEPSIDAVDSFAAPAEIGDPAPIDAEDTTTDVGDDADDDVVVELAAEDRTSAAYQRLGSEGLARLRARYAEVMARIAERPMDEQARDELKARAERLNPDGWVTDEEVREALEQYEGVFEGLRSQVGAGRRRRRRRGKGQPPRPDNP